MRIAVAATTNTATAEISLHSGRTPYFLTFDGDGNLLKVITYPYAETKRGAGQRSVALLAEQGIDLLIGGRFGPTIKEEFARKGIRFIEKSGMRRMLLAKQAASGLFEQSDLPPL